MNKPDADANNSDDIERKQLWTLLRTVSALGIGVILIVVLCLGIALWLNCHYPIGNGGIMLAVGIGAFLSIYWAYRRVAKILQTLFPPHSSPVNGKKL